MHTFFCPDLTEGVRALDQAESGHASRVLRLRSGDTIILLDGKGTIAQAELEECHASKCTFRILSEENHTQRKVRLHVAIAPTKMNDRMEWFLEKAVELGIEAVTPVVCDRSERRVINFDRYDKVIRSAVKQSMQAFLPKLNDAVLFKQFLINRPPGYIAHCAEGDKVEFSSIKVSEGMVTMLIGPEGDFTPAEIAAATENGWKPVTLGGSRLRTETAGIYTCSLVRAWNEF